ncbi:MAG TPA: hypothetical protein VGC54_06600 [Planctomycetota bacterium]
MTTKAVFLFLVFAVLAAMAYAQAPGTGQATATGMSGGSHAAAALTLGPVTPGVAGMVNSITASGAEPNLRVYFVIGFAPGSTSFPECPGFTVDISNPDQVAGIFADQNGNATALGQVGVRFIGTTIYMQAVQVFRTCKVSNLVAHTF